ncbi:hypothetical protein RRG08_067115 [Elysia crispata]|uniref:EF-hand domain-containing protein n=1 Tax=Elysia crispata TaxID=231223 RepID=A0AAE1DH09_9GAST|nr:hypothetical protein RRG08_067115 [Elysia crispata]
MDTDGTLKIDWNEWRRYLILTPSQSLHDILHYWRHSSIQTNHEHWVTHSTAALWNTEGHVKIVRIARKPTGFFLLDPKLDGRSLHTTGPRTLVQIRVIRAPSLTAVVCTLQVHGRWFRLELSEPQA